MPHPKSGHPGALPWHQTDPCDCTSCLTLSRLIRLTTAPGNQTVTFANVGVKTDLEGAVAVLAVDGRGAPGMQRVIQVSGQVKCLLCDEVAVDSVICERCNAAVQFIREVQRKFTVAGLQDFGGHLAELEGSGLMALLQLVTIDALTEWWKNQIREVEIDGS